MPRISEALGEYSARTLRPNYNIAILTTHSRGCQKAWIAKLHHSTLRISTPNNTKRSDMIVLSRTAADDVCDTPRQHAISRLFMPARHHPHLKWAVLYLYPLQTRLAFRTTQNMRAKDYRLTRHNVIYAFTWKATFTNWNLGSRRGQLEARWQVIIVWSIPGTRPQLRPSVLRILWLSLATQICCLNSNYVLIHWWVQMHI